jgi:hypothetical protein
VKNAEFLVQASIDINLETNIDDDHGPMTVNNRKYRSMTQTPCDVSYFVLYLTTLPVIQTTEYDD